jgi:hypothetical protein
MLQSSWRRRAVGHEIGSVAGSASETPTRRIVRPARRSLSQFLRPAPASGLGSAGCSHLIEKRGRCRVEKKETVDPLEGTVGRSQCPGPPASSRGEHGIERTQIVDVSKEFESFEEIVFVRLRERRQPDCEFAGSSCRICPGTMASPNVREFLNDFDRGGCSDSLVADHFDHGPGRVAQRVLGSHGVDEDRRIQDDHADRRLRSRSSSSRRSSGFGTSIGSASRMACSARRCSSPPVGNRWSIASRTTVATDTPRRSASRSRRVQRSSSIRTCSRLFNMLIY